MHIQKKAKEISTNWLHRHPEFKKTKTKADECWVFCLSQPISCKFDAKNKIINIYLGVRSCPLWDKKMDVGIWSLTKLGISTLHGMLGK